MLTNDERAQKAINERRAGWCETHNDFAWLYVDGSIGCFYCCIVEGGSGECAWRELREVSEAVGELRAERTRAETLRAALQTMVNATRISIDTSEKLQITRSFVLEAERALAASVEEPEGAKP